MTNRELQRLTKKWTERLRLQDWSIKVRFATSEEAEDIWGLCMPANTTREAVILIANPRWYKDLGSDAYQADAEVTLVHELCHIHFAPLNHHTGSHKEMVEEQIVSCMAQLLVALDRRDESLIHPQNPKTLSKVARFQ